MSMKKYAKRWKCFSLNWSTHFECRSVQTFCYEIFTGKVVTLKPTRLVATKQNKSTMNEWIKQNRLRMNNLKLNTFNYLKLRRMIKALLQYQIKYIRNRLLIIYLDSFSLCKESLYHFNFWSPVYHLYSCSLISCLKLFNPPLLSLKEISW